MHVGSGQAKRANKNRDRIATELMNAFSATSGPGEPPPHGSCRALLEATPVAERAADEERKGGHR
jgi:hypothetical protein